MTVIGRMTGGWCPWMSRLEATVVAWGFLRCSNNGFGVVLAINEGCGLYGVKVTVDGSLFMWISRHRRGTNFQQ